MFVFLESVTLASLVDDWLNALIARVRGEKTAAAKGEATWIRRSAGLPFCFLAVVQVSFIFQQIFKFFVKQHVFRVSVAYSTSSYHSFYHIHPRRFVDVH